MRPQRAIKCFNIAFVEIHAYSLFVNRLTKQERMVLCFVLSALLVGWVVQAYRTAHPRPQEAVSVKT